MARDEWPPSSSPSRSERSRLTRVPACQRPSVVLPSVSAEASAANQSAPTSTAVRQQPEQPIEAPIGIAAVSGQGAAIVSRMSAPSPSGVMARTVPRAVTMPVNIQAVCLRHDNSRQHVVAEWRLAHDRVEARHGVEALDAERLHRGPAVAAHHGGRMEPGDAVHQVGAQQRGGKLCAALHQHPGDPRLAQRGQRRRRIDAGLGARRPRSA